MAPEIWCAMEDEQMDKPMDKKSDTLRWVPYLKTMLEQRWYSLCSFIILLTLNKP